MPFLARDTSILEADLPDSPTRNTGAEFDVTIASDAGPSNVGSIKHRLYISHTLSTWNTRVFEFGAVLFLANLFPGNLLPASAYALVRAAAAISFAPVIGSYIDHNDRLKVVRLSIGELYTQM